MVSCADPFGGRTTDHTGDLDSVYAHRFPDDAARAKDGVWREVVRHLQRYLPDGPVLDVACDRGDFIRHVRSDERWAIDVRDVSAHLVPGIQFVQVDGPSMADVLPNGHFSAVFMSNYLEHLPSAAVVLTQLRAAHRVLRPGGRLVVLQPNIRLTGGAYWDFLDHKTPLTDRSLVEAGELAGLRTEKVVVRFLPYTTRSRLPQRPWMVRCYLACPPAWSLLGKQTLYVGVRP